MGVRGRVYDALTSDPLDATVDVVEIGKPVYTDADVGDYHRMLLTGTYTITCSADGYQDQFWTVDVVEGPATIQDCAMVPPPYAVVAGGRALIRLFSFDSKSDEMLAAPATPNTRHRSRTRPRTLTDSSSNTMPLLVIVGE